jgi:pantothenate synthetase
MTDPAQPERVHRMKILRTTADARSREHSLTVILVPTRNALDKVHGELIRVACEAVGKDGEVVVSIFVNPLQFEPRPGEMRLPPSRGLCQRPGREYC